MNPRLPLIERGEEGELGRVEHAIRDLEARLPPEQRQQLTAVVVGLCAHMLDLAAPDVQARLRRQGSGKTPYQRMRGDAWWFATTRWLADPTIRTGEMAKAMREWLIAEGHRPPQEKRLREWLAPLAEDEAKRGGRPPAQ